MTDDLYKQKVAFERCTDFMVRMIQKYGNQADLSDDTKDECDSSNFDKSGTTRKYPADNNITGAVEYEYTNEKQG